MFFELLHTRPSLTLHTVLFLLCLLCFRVPSFVVLPPRSSLFLFAFIVVAAINEL